MVEHVPTKDKLSEPLPCHDEKAEVDRQSVVVQGSPVLKSEGILSPQPGIGSRV
jgi:hypothetical protein